MDYEILKSFFQNNYINPTWIDCNYTWGWFDNETGHWTGAVGKVQIINICLFLHLAVHQKGSK